MPSEKMRPCPCLWEENQIPVYVHIDADLSCDGQEKWKMVGMDKCIAPFVAALQRAGINMRGSCCGHGKGPGQIDLSDGWMIRIYLNSEKEKKNA